LVLTRRTFFVWHSWIGLTAGLLLFVICWSGSVAVFSHELDWLTDERLRAAPAEVTNWQAIADNVGESRPDWHILAISEPLHPGFAAEVWVADPDDVWHRIWTDPATGRVLGTTGYFNIQRFFRSFHMSLFIGGWYIWGIPFGYWLVGLAAIMLTVSLVTSLLFYRRFWRGFFKLQRSRGSKVLWSDLHKLAGLWSLWFIALIAATGIWYLAEWKVTSQASVPDPPVVAGGPVRPLPVAVLIEHARLAYPALDIRTVVLDQMEQGLFAVQGQDGAWLIRDRGARVWLDARDGSTIAIRRAGDLPPLHRWIETADPLHFGTFGGLWTKALWFVFGIGLSGMCLTGAYLQAKRQERHGVASRRIPVTAAYLATGFVLLAAAPFAREEMLRWGSDGAMPELPRAAIGVIAVWIGSTLAALGCWVKAVR